MFCIYYIVATVAEDVVLVAVVTLVVTVVFAFVVALVVVASPALHHCCVRIEIKVPSSQSAAKHQHNFIGSAKRAINACQAHPDRETDRQTHIPTRNPIYTAETQSPSPVLASIHAFDSVPSISIYPSICLSIQVPATVWGKCFAVALPLPLLLLLRPILANAHQSAHNGAGIIVFVFSMQSYAKYIRDFHTNTHTQIQAQIQAYIVHNVCVYIPASLCVCVCVSVAYSFITFPPLEVTASQCGVKYTFMITFSICLSYIDEFDIDFLSFIEYPILNLYFDSFSVHVLLLITIYSHIMLFISISKHQIHHRSHLEPVH